MVRMASSRAWYCSGVPFNNLASLIIMLLFYRQFIIKKAE